MGADYSWYYFENLFTTRINYFFFPQVAMPIWFKPVKTKLFFLLSQSLPF